MHEFPKRPFLDGPLVPENGILGPLAHWPIVEFFMVSSHYVQDNKVAYNFWKNCEKAYQIEDKRVIACRQTASARSLHYVIETKRVSSFRLTLQENGCD
jgi:hypothetical protein